MRPTAQEMAIKFRQRDERRRDNAVRCPHGIECDYVHRTQTIQGEDYVVGGDYWHTPHEKCQANFE